MCLTKRGLNFKPCSNLTTKTLSLSPPLSNSDLFISQALVSFASSLYLCLSLAKVPKISRVTLSETILVLLQIIAINSKSLQQSLILSLGLSIAMPPPNKLSRVGRNADSDESETPSNNLWVGNLASDVADSDLMDLFAQYGALDSVTSYSSRSYAFIFFKRIEDAKAAKEALQGAELRGHPVKIEFARPVCSDLCVSLGLSGFRCYLVYGFVSLCNIIYSKFMISAVLWVSTFNPLSFFSDP
jgi:hypothetical protein